MSNCVNSRPQSAPPSGITPQRQRSIKKSVPDKGSEVPKVSICPTSRNEQPNTNNQTLEITENLESLIKFFKDFDAFMPSLEQAKNHLHQIRNVINSNERDKSSPETNDKLKDLENKYTSCTQKYTKIETEHLHLNVKLEQAEESLSKLNADNLELTRILKSVKSDYDDVFDKYKKLQAIVQNCMREKSELEDTLSETHLRLSKHIGEKIAENNPEIADHSDKDRPDKIAELYNKLYDTQYTDAFETARTFFPDKDNSELADILIRLIMKIRVISMEEFQKQESELIQALYRTSQIPECVPAVVTMHLRESKKCAWKEASLSIYQNVFKKAKEETPMGKLVHAVSSYIQLCCDICWLMTIQDPPVVFDLVQENDNFDGNRYKAFTQQGDKIEYVVWPALLLHKNGPLLSKGIVQCYKSDSYGSSTGLNKTKLKDDKDSSI